MTTVTFKSTKEIQRLLHLVHRDLARTRGNIVIAQERIDAEKASDRPILPGSMRKQALRILETGPEQQKILEDAQNALRAALVEARESGEMPYE